MHYGVDVAALRKDDLDKEILAAIDGEVVQGRTPTVLDIGCGSGRQSVRMAEAGATVTALDLAVSKPSLDIDGLGNDSGSLTFIEADIASYVTTAQRYDHILWQRALHYLTYEDAHMVLATLRTQTNASLFISVTGCESEIGAYYPCVSLPLPERFCRLDASAQETFSIDVPVCLYTKDEFQSLLASTGWNVATLRTSAFGNHKAVCVPN